ncbi:hypothetical protein MMC07_004785 [Pseudocyphellaria aurata]|nr:hypothetical protein [Pseudocyphellaria aurata]
MVAGGDQAHSTLEVISQQFRYHEAEQRKSLPSDTGKQVTPDGDKQPIEDNVGLQVARKEDVDRSQNQEEVKWKPLPSDTGKQVAPDGDKQFIEDRSEFGVAQKKDIGRHKIPAHPILMQRLPARRRLILYGIIGSILILGAVLGGVLGSRHQSSGTTSATSPSNSSATSSSAAPTQRNIAAVSFTSNSTNYTRVYFQDNAGQILEASSSEGNMMWTINQTGIHGKNGSVIAAAVSRPSLPLEISIFYLDVDNLIHDVTYTASTGWTSGTLSAQGHTAMANSSLSAMYNWCRHCANTTIIVFQDENGFVQIGNFTSEGWILKQLGQDLQPALGTAFALLPFYISGWADRINLYHQMSNLSLAVASWRPKVAFQGGNGWSLNADIFDSIPFSSPIAAASSYSNVSTNDGPAWIEVVSLSNTGIEVDTWSGATNDWLAHNLHPSAMANSTNNVRRYGSLAVTATGSAFAVVKQDGQADSIENWQVADDTVDWSLIGNLDLNGTWG